MNDKHFASLIVQTVKPDGTAAGQDQYPGNSHEAHTLLSLRPGDFYEKGGRAHIVRRIELTKENVYVISVDERSASRTMQLMHLNQDECFVDPDTNLRYQVVEHVHGAVNALDETGKSKTFARDKVVWVTK